MSTRRVIEKLRDRATAAGYKVFCGKYVEEIDIARGPVLSIRIGPAGLSKVDSKPVEFSQLDVVVEWHGRVSGDDPILDLLDAGDELKNDLIKPNCSGEDNLDGTAFWIRPGKISYWQDSGRTNRGTVSLAASIKFKS